MSGSGEATLELKVVPDWTQFDNELKQREAKGINLRVNGIGGVGAGSTAGGFGGSTSTDPNVRSAQGDQHLNQMLARATANREAATTYAMSIGSMRDMGTLGSGLSRTRRIPPYDYDQDWFGTRRMLPGGGGPGVLQGHGGGGGGQNYTGGGRMNFGRASAPTFATVNARGGVDPLSYDPGSDSFINPETGQEYMTGSHEPGWPGGPNGGRWGMGGRGGRGGGGGSRARRGRSLYDIIGRYAPIGIGLQAAGNMGNAWTQNQFNAISAAGDPLAMASASARATSSYFEGIPFVGGAAAFLGTGAQELQRSYAVTAAQEQNQGASFASRQQRTESLVSSQGQTSYSTAISNYAKDVAKANADFNVQELKNNTENSKQIQDAGLRNQKAKKLIGQNLNIDLSSFDIHGADNQSIVWGGAANPSKNFYANRYSAQIESQRKAAVAESSRIIGNYDQLGANNLATKNAALSAAERDHQIALTGITSPGTEALMRAGLNPLGAQLQGIGTATNLGILASKDDPAARAAYIKSGQDQAAAARQEYSHTINQDIIAFQSGGRSAIAGANLNPIGAARSTMEGKLANIAANRPTNNAFGTAPETNRRLDAEAQAAKDDFTAAEINANRETRLNFAGSRSNLLAAALRPVEASALERQTSMNELNATLMSNNVGNGLTQAQIIAKLPAGSDYFTKKATIDNKFDTDKITRDREYNIAGIGAAGEISANKFLMMGDPVSAINARAQADRDRINAQYAGDSPEAKAARDSLLTASKSNQDMDVATRKRLDSVILAQSIGAVDVTGLESKGKTYSAQVASIKDATEAAVKALDPTQTNYPTLKQNVLQTGINQEMTLQRQMRYEMTIGPTKTASILDPYSLGPRGQAAVLRNEQPGEAIGGIKDAIATMQAAIVQAIHDLHGPPGAP